MLAEFKQVHGDLEAALSQLDLLTRADTPDEAVLAQARWRLSRASGARRKLLDTAVTMLLDRVSESDRLELRTLQELNATQLKASTSHIGSWSLREVVADWPGYRRASARMRQSLRDLIAADRASLYPMLERLAP